MISFLATNNCIQIGRKEEAGFLNWLFMIRWKSEGVGRIFILAFSAPVYCVIRHINLAGALFRRVLRLLLHLLLLGDKLVELPIKSISGY